MNIWHVDCNNETFYFANLKDVLASIGTTWPADKIKVDVTHDAGIIVSDVEDGQVLLYATMETVREQPYNMILHHRK